jgi:hypothetical protein
MITGPIYRRIQSQKNSTCGSARLRDLDWSNWWMDQSVNCVYLHVRRLHPEYDGNCEAHATWHRVHCRMTDAPRIAVRNGKLCWVIDRS